MNNGAALMAEEKPTIEFADFAKVDLRVARITAAELHPNADKLLKLQLDDGSGEPRQICAGIKAYYNPEELVGKSIVIVANLEPRKLRGEISQGMLLAASSPPDENEERNVVLLTLDREIPPGSTVS
ncbi:MAG TPA: methionine--tRNA ligase subunit beta [Phycisphaeraceae bacterium]|nr:methionine--tRNA ligase subunit beta [Phycisphaeraceae bacterium]